MRKLLFPTIALLALITFTISGCSGKPKSDEDRNALKHDDSFVKASITGETSNFSMMMPEYLTESFDLNAEASLQYQNIYKEVYVIVLDESKEDYVAMYRDILEDYDSTKSVLENYAEGQLEMIESNMETVTSKTSRNLTINGNPAIAYDVNGTQTDIADAMGFTVAFVEGKSTIYMIMAWTYEKEKLNYQDDIDAMINSFKEE